jgi:hypothetical protein
MPGEQELVIRSHVRYGRDTYTVTADGFLKVPIEASYLYDGLREVLNLYRGLKPVTFEPEFAENDDVGEGDAIPFEDAQKEEVCRIVEEHNRTVEEQKPTPCVT